MKPVLIALYSSNMRSGKSTVASMLTERLFGMTQSFAAPFYGFIIEIAAPFMEGGEAEVRAWLSDERKDKALIPHLGVTLRSMLQTIGTNWGRECVNSNLWVMLAEQKAQKALKAYSVVYDDMRFPSEYDMVKRNGGKCIRILRPGEGSRGDTGIGEGLLDRHDFDYYINNVGTLQDLKGSVRACADRLYDPATTEAFRR